MSSKDKAEQLLDKFHVEIMDFNITDVVLEDTAKILALICVEEMKKASTRITQHLPNHWIGTEQEYYEEVKQEIEKL